MNPSCDTVEYASTFLMSVAARPMLAANAAVRAPTPATTAIAAGAAAYSADIRVTMYTPAVTIVAAWISADTGVGPAIASGSHTYSGTCALFPHAPTNSSSAAAVRYPTLTPACPVRTPAITPEISIVP